MAVLGPFICLLLIADSDMYSFNFFQQDLCTFLISRACKNSTLANYLYWYVKIILFHVIPLSYFSHAETQKTYNEGHHQMPGFCAYAIHHHHSCVHRSQCHHILSSANFSITTYKCLWWLSLLPVWSVFLFCYFSSI